MRNAKVVTGTAVKAVTRRSVVKTPDRFAGEIIGPKQVAEMLNVCLKTVHNLSQRGKLPHTRVGNLYRFSRTEIAKISPSNVKIVSDATLSDGNA